MLIRAYLRASTSEQDANRARNQLDAFASDHHQTIATRYIENASGASPNRPELRRMLDEAHEGDVLLVESVDRLSRLPGREWDALRAEIKSKGLRVVAVDLPTSHRAMQNDNGDDFTARMLDAVSEMMLDMAAAIARKDYQQRRDRQAQGIEKAKAAGVYQGRPIDPDLHRRVSELLSKGFSVRKTAEHAQCSTSTVQRVKKGLDAGNKSV